MHSTHSNHHSRITGWVWTIALSAILLLGGTHWTVPTSRFVAQIIGLCMLVCAIGSVHKFTLRKLHGIDWVLIALLALFALHLLPLPPALWAMLPGRELAIEVDRTVFGALQWRSISLDPNATLSALAMLVPALGVYAAVRTGDDMRQGALLRAVVIAGAAGLVLGFVQMAVPVQIYDAADHAFPIGFFTNHNHQATFLLCALPLAAAYTVTQDAAPSDRPRLSAPDAVLGLTALLVIIGCLATASRTGAALIPIALFGTALAWMSARGVASGKFLRPLLLIAGAIMLSILLIVLLGGDGLDAVIRRGSLLKDQRFDFWPIVLAVTAAYWPAGSGIGSFLPAYQAFEPLSAISPLYLNNAHNDYLEIALESGVPGLLLILAAIGELGSAGWAAWRNKGHSLHRTLQRLAAVVILICLLHSLVDYPLRTVTISCLFALAAALLCRKGVDDIDVFAEDGGRQMQNNCNLSVETPDPRL